MARKTIEMRLAEIEVQKKALQARLSRQERAHDTRRKVLLGAFVLHRLEASDDEEFSRCLGDWLRRELPGFLTRDVDKELFADLLKPFMLAKVPVVALPSGREAPAGQGHAECAGAERRTFAAAAIAARAHLAFFIRLLASWDEAGVHGVGEELTGVRRIRAETVGGRKGPRRSTFRLEL